MEYDPGKIEKKWQQKWQNEGIYLVDVLSGKPPCFVIDMFPYPSGSSMHVGHPRGYVATDVYSRFKRMNGFNVLHPMGWDAFGLPAEETAIQNKEYPTATVHRNILKFKEQLIMLGIGYDWSREINTTDPAYYIHTQRIFLEFFRRGLALNNTVPVNWCPELGTVLANEDIVNGKSERGDHPVFQRPMRQWILAITKYADRLIDDLDKLPRWPEKVKNAQRNWIGRSEGHEFEFLTDTGVSIPVFTTRIETVPGATFIGLAPESDLLNKIMPYVSNAVEVRQYVEMSDQKTSLDRQVSNQKTGVVLKGLNAINPITGFLIPVIVTDYVLSSYGTGAIMGVPAHDNRDNDLAKAFGIPIIEVVENELIINAASLNGKTVADARKEIAERVDAKTQKRYKIRDWVFSRQRFWGEPFPIVWIEGRDRYEIIAKGPVGPWLPTQPVFYIEGSVEYFAVPVLPQFLGAMRLPQVDSYESTGTMEGPLAGIDEWVNAFLNPDTGEVLNHSGGVGWFSVRRETNTMPQWAGSSWYWLRYMDPQNEEAPFSKESSEYWGPVNLYAGADHAVAHLIYARFWHKVMQDAGMVDFPEPFERLEFLGYILAADGTKISKRKGNSRTPEEVVEQVGADAFRLYEMAIGPFEKAIPWNDNGLVGARRFLDRVWRLGEVVLEKNVEISDPIVLSSIHKAIKKVGDDIEAFKFNTAVSSLMICLNEIQDKNVSILDFKSYIALLAPFAPHVAEEIWSKYKGGKLVHASSWPKADRNLVMEDVVVLPIQINGKHRSEVRISVDTDEKAIKEMALQDPVIQKHLLGKELKKIVYVPSRIINIVV